MDSISQQLVRAAQSLRARVDRLKFGEPVAHVYNPLLYAWEAHEKYLRQYGNNRKRVVFLGMNPGPFGMVQTGVPFGEVQSVRDWMLIQAPVVKPPQEHPRRPIEGFLCKRSEVSGARLWGLFAKRFPRAVDFFDTHFVVNYCPLAFLETSGVNRTPNKLSPAEKRALFAVCDQHLRDVIRILQPEWLIAVGGFAEICARRVFPIGQPKIASILHPSPASPAANRDWAGVATTTLQALGVWPKSIECKRVGNDR